MTTALTLPQRAAVALGTAEHEKDLIALVAQSADIVSVENADGREQAHRVGMTLRNARTGITKAGKLARDDATAFGKAVIAEEKRLVAIVEPEEARVLGLRDTFDAAEQARKDALIAAERARIDGIQADIQAIRNVTLTMVGKSSSSMWDAIELLDQIQFTEERFAKFKPDAARAVGDAMDAITGMYRGAKEAEEVRIQQEKDAAAVLLKKQQAELAEQQAQFKRDQIAAADAEQKRRDLVEVERDQMIDAQLKVDAKRAQEQRDAQAKIDAATEALRVERADLDAQKAALATPVPVEVVIVPEPERMPLVSETAGINFIKKIAPPPFRPTAEEVIRVLSAHYAEPVETVAEWLESMFGAEFLA
ncbi:hypothetical protein [Glaciimonas immobilis]|uniref:Uncharacterized protein n=1 Tax=Glaciimonas immobilis TaxID=728004 RepID=A0A840RT46_9BURK|nr:hypothetical protein [Glaciimonas immobilis]KAF3997500.1 hypothetical protein HAV38_12530 [Glaciimonas immobilis]MBB5200823.1 hypothetical protein [Glaciimonas immobilis]